MVFGKRWMLLAALCAVSYCSASDAVISLREEAVVSEKDIHLSDIAVVDVQDSSMQLISSAVVGAAPRAGLVSYLRRSDIESVLRTHTPFKAAVQWTGAAAVAVRSSTETMKGRVLGAIAADHVRKQTQSRFPNAIVQASQDLPDVEVRHGSYDVRARPLTLAHPRARETVWLDIVGKDGVERSVVVPVQVSIPVEGTVAARDLDVGHILVAEDIAQQQVDLAAVDSEIVDVASAVGARALRPIKAGEVLRRRTVAPKGSIVRGSVVKVSIVDGVVRIDASGVVQTDPSPTGRVQVRLANGSMIEAQASGNGTVTIE